MNKSFRYNLIKVFAFVLSICTCFAIASVSNKKTVAADESTPAFVVEDVIRLDEGKVGLNFVTTVNGAWLQENTAENYSFGLIVAPNDKVGAFNAEATVDENWNAMDGYEFVFKANQAVTEGFTANATIGFDKETILGFDGVAEENIDAVLAGFYAKEFVAIPYVMMDGAIKYGDKVVSSMEKVAEEALTNPELAEKAEMYLPGAVTTLDVTSYVSKEDGIVVVKEGYNAEAYSKVIVNGEAVEFAVVDGVIVISNIESFKAGYTDVVLKKVDGGYDVVNVLIADKALKNATDVQMAFDITAPIFTDASTSSGSTIDKSANLGANRNVYVLANDIDMTGITMHNRIKPKQNITSTDGNITLTTAVDAELGFGGIFDGMGYSISNAKVALTNAAVYLTGGGAMYNSPSNGFFYNLLAGGEIRNVAFLNLDDNYDGFAYYGLSGVLGYNNFGATMENVYVDISANTYVSRGLFSNLPAGVTYKNVVVNSPRNDYDFATHLASIGDKNHFAYNYGSLYGGAQGGSADVQYLNFENVIVASPMPVTSVKGTTGGIETVTKVIYGENETELFYDYADANYTGKTVAEAIQYQIDNGIVDNNRKVIVAEGVRRYDDLAKASTDVAVSELIATGLFRVVDGELTWHDVKVNRQISDVVEFDALAGGVLKTDVLEGKEILSAKVGDTVVTYSEGKFVGVPNLEAEENKIFTLVVETKDIIYTFTNVEYKGREIAIITDEVDFDATKGELVASVLGEKTIVSAKVNGVEVYVDGKFVGVPELNNLNSEDQLFAMIIETEDAVYTFNNVKYWASIISDQNELKAALDGYVYSSSNKNNLGFYKLDTNITIDKATWTVFDYNDMKAADGSRFNGAQVGVGFAGIFDGCGYTINFNGTGAGEFGIFGSFGMGAQLGIKRPATVKNLAILGYAQNWKPVLAQYTMNHTYNKGVLLENIYVTWLRTAVQAGLIYEPNSGNTVIRNVMVNVENNIEYSKGIPEGKSQNLSVGYYGGTLYYTLRRGSTALANLTDNFVSLGKGALVKKTNYVMNTNFERWFASASDGAGGYVHTIKNTGWGGSPVGAGVNEVYLGYASNQEYGDTTLITGMKEGFAEIAKKYAISTAIPGYYCAVCGEEFSLTEGTCSTCVDGDGAPIALTKSTNLWKEEISYVWAFTKISAVDSSDTKTNGEMVFANTYKYNSTAEMKASGNTFDSFVGEAGNGMWAVVEGALTWVGANA